MWALHFKQILGLMNWILIGIVVLVVAYFIYLYNNFVRLTQQAKEAWADIDVQLKRRYDLIPNLIETVKGYAAHERETLDAVTQARTAATSTHIDVGAITPEQMAAMSASGLASSQMASNDAINKVETYNAQNQFATDQFNIGQSAKEQIYNENAIQAYQDKAFGALNANESAWRNYYTQNNLDNANNFNTIDRANIINAENSNYQYIPGLGIQYLNNKGVNYADPEFNKQLEKLTPQERLKYQSEMFKGSDKTNALIKAKQRSIS